MQVGAIKYKNFIKCSEIVYRFKIKHLKNPFNIFSLTTRLMICLLTSNMYAQTQDSLDLQGPIASSPFKVLPLKKIQVNGYYRFFGINRDLKDAFTVIPGNAYANAPAYILGTGDVYRDPPLMLLNIGVQASSKTYVGMDYALYHNFSGQPGSGIVNLNLGINLTGSFQTVYGKYTAHMGGINWIDMSGMVFSSFIGYQRFSLFERWPWEGNAIAHERASNYFEYGNISRDMRFGMQPFKGLLVDGNDIPGNISFRLLYGTTPAQAIIDSKIPSYTVGGRLRKKLNNHVLGLQFMDYKVYPDSLAKEEAGIQLQTFSYDYEKDGLEIAAELGRGQLYSEIQKKGWGNALRLKIKTPKKWFMIPVEVEAFYLSPNFVNYYGNFLSSNTTVLSSSAVNQGGATNASSGGISNFSGSITDVGQVSNNRQGLSLNSWINLGRNTKLNLGNMFSQEIEQMGNKLAFGHKINALPFSRFAPFTNNIGAYNNWTSYFRGFSQTMQIVDTAANGMTKSLTGFNMFQIQLKQRFSWGRIPGYLLYVGSFGSAQNFLAVIPVLNNKAYLQTQYHELDGIFQIRNGIGLITSFGYERIVGNNQMNKGDNNDGKIGSVLNNPVNQQSTMYGLGLDIKLNDNMNMYMRHRIFSQKDQSFTKDHIEGTESSIELKLFF